MSTQGHPTDIVFLSGVRTPFGTFGGTLKGFSANELGALAAREAIVRAGIPAEAIDHTIFGNALQTSADAIYHARHVALKAGVPIEKPSLTVNRLCGSGFQSIVSGAMEILLGQAQCVLAGGAESMSQAPHVIRGARFGDLRLGPPQPGNFEDMLWSSLTDTQCDLSMAQTAETLGDKLAIDRAASDALALASQHNAGRAWKEGAYAAEVMGVPIKKRGETVEFRTDEHMRPDTTAEALAALRPYFRKDGLVTAGNASGIGDGGAAVVVSSSGFASAHGLKPIGRLVSWGICGVDPSIMGWGPVPASRKALEMAGMTLDQMTLVEINEAFAPQAAACAKDLGVPMEKLNVDGGAIAITHPLAASGTRITMHLLHALKRRGGGFGLGTACIGGGQGIAVVVEAF